MELDFEPADYLTNAFVESTLRDGVAEFNLEEMEFVGDGVQVLNSYIEGEGRRLKQCSSSVAAP